MTKQMRCFAGSAVALFVALAIGQVATAEGPTTQPTRQSHTDKPKKVIYLLDKSGSMLSVFGAMKQQVKDSVQALKAQDRFDLIYFSDEGADALASDDLLKADADNKKKAMDFVDNEVASGGTLPLPAIQLALKLKPDEIDLVTDGFDQIASFDEVIKAFHDGNPDGKIKVNCIFLQSDEDPKLEAALKEICKENNGTFKKVLKSDM